MLLSRHLGRSGLMVNTSWTKENLACSHFSQADGSVLLKETMNTFVPRDPQ